MGLSLEISPAAMDMLVKEGSDFSMGARPLKRAIQRLIEDPISDSYFYKVMLLKELSSRPM